MADKDTENPFHTRVVLVVQELDEEGNVIDTPSEQVLADDTDDTSFGQKSDDFFNEIIRKTRRV